VIEASLFHASLYALLTEVLDAFDSMQNLRFTCQWRFKSMSSGLSHHVVLRHDTNDLENLAFPIFQVKWRWR